MCKPWPNSQPPCATSTVPSVYTCTSAPAYNTGHHDTHTCTSVPAYNNVQIRLTYRQYLCHTRLSTKSCCTGSLISTAKQFYKHGSGDIWLQSSSSPRALPVIWGRRNGHAYHSSTLSCPVLSYTFNPKLSISLLLKSFSDFFSISFLVLVHLTFFLVCAPVLSLKIPALL